jgi:hypothetical protein
LPPDFCCFLAWLILWPWRRRHMFLQNVSELLLDYTMYLRRLYYL